MPIKVTARMWSWTFEYPNGVQTDTLYVPVKEPVKLSLTSMDVNHSMYIPAFRMKKDVIPNRENIMWFSTPGPVTTWRARSTAACAMPICTRKWSPWIPRRSGLVHEDLRGEQAKVYGPFESPVIALRRHNT